jgi:very-short-patch-repair endonuclease
MPKEWRASKKIKQAAKDLRRRMTPAEKRLWLAIRDRKIDGHYFRRQYPIKHFVADFCCTEMRLIVDLDGQSLAPVYRGLRCGAAGVA